jgi:hypothetical protein
MIATDPRAEHGAALVVALALAALAIVVTTGMVGVSPAIAERAVCMLRTLGPAGVAGCDGERALPRDLHLVQVADRAGPEVDVRGIDELLAPGRSIRTLRRGGRLSLGSYPLFIQLEAGTRFTVELAPLQPYLLTIRPDRPIVVYRRGADGRPVVAYVVRELMARRPRRAPIDGRWWSDVAGAMITPRPTGEDQPVLDELLRGLFDAAILGATGEPSPERDALVERMRLAIPHIDEFWRGLLDDRYTSPRRVVVSGHPAQMSMANTLTGEAVILGLSDLSGHRGGEAAFLHTLSHEWGHHVQFLLRGASPVNATVAQRVRWEREADCLAGVWLRHARDSGFISPALFEEAHRAPLQAGNPRGPFTGSDGERWTRIGSSQPPAGALERCGVGATW